MIILPNSKEPLFASFEQKVGKAIIYFDQEGMAACINIAARTNYKECCICHNCCISFIAHDDGTYTCAACGKFPREQLLV